MKKYRFLETKAGRAILDLDKEIAEKGLDPIKLNVIGQRILILDGYCENHQNNTADIEYQIDKYYDEYLDIVIGIGKKHDLGKDWFIDNVLVSYCTLQNFKSAIGELHFTKELKLDNITLEFIDPEDILKLKLIAVDTDMLMVINIPFDRTGGKEIKRKVLHRDLNELRKILEQANRPYTELLNQYDDLILHPETKNVITRYFDIVAERKKRSGSD